MSSAIIREPDPARRATIPGRTPLLRTRSSCSSKFDSCKRGGRRGAHYFCRCIVARRSVRRRAMTGKGMTALLLVSVALGACASQGVFSPEVLEGVDPSFDFSRWRMLPNQAEHRKIQLGGAI